MIEEADRDGDGEISEEEFMRIMRKTNLFWALLWLPKPKGMTPTSWPKSIPKLIAYKRQKEVSRVSL